MSGPKTKDNQQWGRVSTTGTTPGNVSVDDEGREPLVDEFGRLWVRDISPIVPPIFTTRNQLIAASFTGNSFRTIAVGPGFLQSITGFMSASASAFPLYVQLSDAAGAPGGQSIVIPLLAINVAFSYSVGFEFAAGCVVALSTTPTGYTAALAGDVTLTQGVFWT